MDKIGNVNTSHHIGTNNTHRLRGGKKVLSQFELMKVRGGTQCSPSTDLTGLAWDADGETVGLFPLEGGVGLVVKVEQLRPYRRARVRFSRRMVCLSPVGLERASIMSASTEANGDV